MKKLNTFRKYLLLYTAILLVLGILFSLHVVKSLKMYEKNQVHTFIKHELRTNKSLGDTGFELSEFESSKDIKAALSALVDNSQLTIKEKESGHYRISADGMDIMDITLEEGKKVTRLGILSFNILSTKEIKFLSEKGIYSYVIKVPSNFVIEVNGKMVGDVHKSKVENLDGYIGIKSDKVPKINVYELAGFINKPEIIIKNGKGEVVEGVLKDNVISALDYHSTNDDKEAMDLLVKPMDVMALAKDYSLFMTNDLGGSMRGFSKLEKFFIKDSDMYNLARGWATGVDITFVSAHTFKNPMFTNESLTNFKVYNNEAFSVQVHLEKNMIVSGKDRVDTMNDEWFFVYEDGWKLVDMKYITKGN